MSVTRDNRVGRGELRCGDMPMVPRADRRPTVSGVITVETDLPAGSRLFLSAWPETIAGCTWLRTRLEIPVKGGRPRRRGAP
jgi:hypothetical protein